MSSSPLSSSDPAATTRRTTEGLLEESVSVAVPSSTIVGAADPGKPSVVVPVLPNNKVTPQPSSLQLQAAEVRPQPPSTTGNKRQQEIEQEAGVVAGQFNCIHQGAGGILYAGEKALLFRGNFFLFENKIRIPWDSVRQVSKLDQGVQICTNDNELHSFLGMRNASRTFPILVHLHNDALLDRKSNASKISLEYLGERTSRAMDRRNSDPAAMSMANIALPPLAADVGSGPAAFSPSAIVLTDKKKSPTPAAAIHKTETETGNGVDTAASKGASSATPTKTGAKPSGAKKEPSPSPSVKSVMNKTTAPVVPPSTIIPGLPDEEAKALLGNIKLDPPVACTHNKMNGHLHAGTEGLYFYGKGKFWGERRIHFPVGSISRAKLLQPDKDSGRLPQPQQPLFGPAATGINATTTTTTTGEQKKGVRITTRDEKDYEFLDMEDPDMLWAILISHYNQINREVAMANARAAEKGNRSLVRCNSDPELITLTAGSSIRDWVPQEGPVALGGQVGSGTSKSHLKRNEVLSPLQEEAPPQVVPPAAQPDVDLNKEWAGVVAKKSDFANLVVDNMELKCSLKQFLQHFWANDAKHSMGIFLESIGETKVKCSEWKTEDTGDIKIQKRIVEYMHAVNQPLLPPAAEARKEQRLVHYGSVGMCLESRTLVKGLPLVDCFYIDDRIRVEAKGPDKVCVSMEFQITFVKSTMFKSVITKQSRAEFLDYFQKMGSFTSQALEGGPPLAAPPSVAPPIPVVVEKGPPTLADPLQPYLLPILGGIALVLPLVVLLQLYTLRQLGQLRMELAAAAALPMEGSITE